MEASVNVFNIPSEGSKGAEPHTKLQEDAMEGWSFQGRRRHAPKLASPRQESHQSFPRTPQQETTPGGKRGQLHFEVHPSYFTSLGISIPPNRELFKARVWPVLIREKNSQKETLVHSKNQTRPSLPLHIRTTRLADAEWSHDSTWADLIQHLEMELEEKVLRYRLTLKDRPQLEWSWQEEKSRGGTECTILTHIDIGSNALSIQNKRHLHWKALDGAPRMNNEVKFSAPAHNLLTKTEAENSARQENKNRLASIQASPQAAKKK